MANKYALFPFNLQLSSGASVFVDAGSQQTAGGTITTACPSAFTTAMTLGLTTVPVANPNPVPQSVTISGGTVTAISISGGASVGTSGTFTVPVGGTLTVTYSAAPTLTVADIAPSAGYPFVNGILAGYLAAYPSGPQIS